MFIRVQHFSFDSSWLIIKPGHWQESSSYFLEQVILKPVRTHNERGWKCLKLISILELEINEEAENTGFDWYWYFKKFWSYTKKQSEFFSPKNMEVWMEMDVKGVNG